MAKKGSKALIGIKCMGFDFYEWGFDWYQACFDGYQVCFVEYAMCFDSCLRGVYGHFLKLLRGVYAPSFEPRLSVGGLISLVIGLPTPQTCRNGYL